MTERSEVFRAAANSISEGCTVLDEHILFRDGDKITVAVNRCRHQGGTFRLDADCLRCPRHNWRLDPRTMQYINPAGMSHPTLNVQRDGSDIVASEVVSNHLWADLNQSPAPLRAGELTIKFLAHACAEIRCGSTRIVTDPWLVGPAFTRGWWLAHNPPTDWLDTLSEATAIYISHNHSDHLNPHTLKKLAAVQPEVPVFVPNFGSASCERLVRQTGLRNVVSVSFGVWHTLDSETRFMILCDTAGREDSGILIDFRGHLILNTVDCSNLNNGVLPEKVDVLLTAFAGGASGYPVCWGELYAVEEIRRRVARNRASRVLNLKKMVHLVNPKIMIPFAGYFTEAHPADADIRELNAKNSPELAIAAAEQNPGTKGWLPIPGATLDVSSGLATSRDAPPPRLSWDDEFSTYIAPIDSSLHFVELQHLDGVRRYFDWVGFRGDLVLHVIETDERFESQLREFFVDFRNGAVTGGAPIGNYRYERMTVRATSFRHVLRTCEPWEELSIGFQARFFRNPDKYNFDFWDHMQNNLLAGSPWR